MLPLMRSRISAARQLRRGRQIGRHMTWDAGLDLVEHRHRRTDLPGRAVAALVAVVLHEGGLHRMQVVRRPKPFDGRDPVALCMTASVRHETDASAIDDDGARAALALIAAFLRAGELQMFAQCVEQRCPGIEFEIVPRAVHGECDL